MRRNYFNSFKPLSTPDGNLWVQVTNKGRTKVIPLMSEEAQMLYKLYYREKEHKMISKKELEDVFEEMQLDAFQNKIDHILESRIYTDDEGVYYNLNDGKGNVVAIEEGKCTIDKLEECVVRTDKDAK